MEQRLIDGLALYCDLKKLEELARQRYLDTPLDSPVFGTYKAQMHERTSLKEMVSASPAIDPVHAAGGCYCRECEYYEPNRPDQTSCLNPNGLSDPIDTDFCSYGERKQNEILD